MAANLLRGKVSTFSKAAVIDYQHLRVAIVGRSNCGKSTLFNRLLRRRAALTSSMPGLTRDRLQATATLYDMQFTILDTPGVERTGKKKDMDEFDNDLHVQTSLALQEADLAVFTVDGAEGLHVLDQDLAKWVRRHKKPVVLVANKCETMRANLEVDHEIYKLGMGEPLLISAEHGHGMPDLYTRLKTELADLSDGAERRTIVDPSENEASKELQLAIVGRPNSGKSTLMNRILGHHRVTVGDKPGVTRDSVAVDFEWRGQKLKLVDTAGLVGTTKTQFDKREEAEAMGMARSLRSIRYASVVALTLDAERVIQVGKDGKITAICEKKEKAIANYVYDNGRGLLLCVTKWDTIQGDDRRAEAKKQLLELWEEELSGLKGVSMVFLSGLEGEGVKQLIPAAMDIHTLWGMRINTGLLNRWFTEMKRFYDTGSGARVGTGKRKSSHPTFKYITQVKTRPPTFAFFGPNLQEKMINHSYTRFLINSLRKEFEIFGIPIRVYMRKGNNQVNSRR